MFNLKKQLDISKITDRDFIATIGIKESDLNDLTTSDNESAQL